MSLLGTFIRLLARSCYTLARWSGSLSRFFDGLLPAVLPPCHLNALMRQHYTEYYAQEFRLAQVRPEQCTLEAWEEAALDRLPMISGTILVLGSGWGREAIALAQRGLTVIGLETDANALRTAARLAARTKAPARFVRASFLHWPLAPGSADALFLSDAMYSAIPSRSGRQAWLVRAGRIIKPGGCIILSFQTRQAHLSTRRTLCDRLNNLLVTLPGANPGYQQGDRYEIGHFMHEFQDEGELTDELQGADMMIRDVNWTDAVAVITASQDSPTTVIS